jgi:hypothetical protein
MRLDRLLVSYPNCDEFQLDRVLVFVSYDQVRDRSRQLIDAENRLPALVADISTVEQIVKDHVNSTTSATVIGIRIQPDGTASYDCTFFDGEYEDQPFYVTRLGTGELCMET